MILREEAESALEDPRLVVTVIRVKVENGPVDDILVTEILVFVILLVLDEMSEVVERLRCEVVTMFKVVRDDTSEVLNALSDDSIVVLVINVGDVSGNDGELLVAIDEIEELPIVIVEVETEKPLVVIVWDATEGLLVAVAEVINDDGTGLFNAVPDEVKGDEMGLFITVPGDIKDDETGLFITVSGDVKDGI